MQAIAKSMKNKNLINVAFLPALENKRKQKGCLGEMQINIVCKKKKHSISELLIAKNRRFLIGIVVAFCQKKRLTSSRK